jgi:hypothetical protein
MFRSTASVRFAAARLAHVEESLRVHARIYMLRLSGRGFNQGIKGKQGYGSIARGLRLGFGFILRNRDMSGPRRGQSGPVVFGDYRYRDLPGSHGIAAGCGN